MITGIIGLLTLIASYIFLLPWIRRNLPTIQHPHSYHADILQGQNDSHDEPVADGIKLTDVDTSLDGDKKKITRNNSFRMGLGVVVQCSPTPSENGSSHGSHGSRSSHGSLSSHGSIHKTETQDGEKTNKDDEEEDIEDMDATPPTETDDALFCFRVLLVFNAALKSFAHGANDTANATGPFSAVLEIHDYGYDICSDDSRRSPIWIMVMAGFFVALGILTFGHKVITTVGEKLVVIDYHSGFCIELGSCVSVVLATQLGIPVSTTHCQVCRR